MVVLSLSMVIFLARPRSSIFTFSSLMPRSSVMALPRVSDEVGREVAAVELHAFHNFERGLHRLRFLDGDDAVLAHLLHGFGDDAADLLVVVGGNGADLRDHFALDVLVEPLDFLDGNFDGLFYAALESRGAGARRDGLHPFAKDGLREHGRSGRAVTGNVGSLGSDFAHHLRAHVLERILQLDFLGYGHAVLGDDGRAELPFDHRVAALGAEGDLHCVGKSVHAAQNRLAGILTSYNLLRHFSIPPDNLRTAKPPRKSTGRKTRHYSLQTTTCANRQPWPRRSASPGSPPREGSGTLHLQSLFPYRCTCQRERGRQP